MLSDRLSRPDGLQIPEGKFYLGDVGMHADLIFYLPSAKQSITSTSLLQGTGLRMQKSYSI
jgi:hypothetical protein